MSTTTHPLDDIVATYRLNKAKAYVCAIYQIVNKPVGRGRRHPDPQTIINHLSNVNKSYVFWDYVRQTTPGYQHKPVPSQETVDLICELITLIEECKR